MRFVVPYFISPHAIKRFQAHVARIPAAQIINIIQLRLQAPGKPAQWEISNGKMTPLFRAEYGTNSAGRPRVFYIPVVTGDGRWPAVPTVITSNSPLHKRLSAGTAGEVYVKKRGGWQ